MSNSVVDNFFEVWWLGYAAGTGTDAERAIAWRAWQASKKTLLFRQAQEKKGNVQPII